jgi:pyruvate dehydrogenase E1 component alpha subunit
MATATAQPTNRSASSDVERRMLRQMLLVRRFEEKAAEAYALGKIGGFCHLYIGQEAVAVGSLGALRDDDYVISSYREHGQALVRGIPPSAVMAELFGKATGCSKGKGGSMHLFDAGRRFMGGHGIVGGHIPLAAGLGFAIRYRGGDQVCICYFGEAAVNIGAFHEALNMAAVWKAPVVFVCENNQYMEYTPIGEVTAVEHPAADRASAYGLESILVDGNDVDAVHATARTAIDRARAGDGPSLIEALTYRHGGHSRADPGKYRPDDEVAAWKARDPIPADRARLEAAGVDGATLDAIEAETHDAVAAAEAEARAAPEPSADVLMTQVWADGGSSWRN